jgi:formyl-CoA transferase
MVLALEGIRMVDVAQVAAVPMAARHLADFGADVIHIENPGPGDSWRTYQVGQGNGNAGPSSSINYNWEASNRNKRSIAVDLSRETAGR